MSASPACFGSEWPISVVDANEIDESSASPAGNGIKPANALPLRLISEAKAAFELVLGSKLLPLCPKGFPNTLGQIDAAGIRDLVDGWILFTA